MVGELVWRHIGAEHDWLYMVDASGAETTALATLRDFARFGLLIANRGFVDQKRVRRAVAVESILGGGDRDVFANGDHPTLPGWSYRSQRWFRHVDDRICPVARGAYGQLLVVDPRNELVIARFGSIRDAPLSLLDPMLWPLVDAITAEVTRCT